MSLCVSCPQGHVVCLDPANLGAVVACPICLVPFRAEDAESAAHYARKEEKKPRRPRDDDDDEDDEEEKPRKKKPVVAKKDVEKPKKKPIVKKKEEDDEDEDEEEGDEDAEEEIDWTPRKRQLNLCSIGLTIMIIAIGAMMFFTATFMVAMDNYTFGIAIAMNSQAKPNELDLENAWFVMLVCITVPFILLTQLLLLVGLGFSFTVPSKVEARGMVISGVVFAALFFLVGLLALLGHYQIIVEGEVRAERMVHLMGGAAGLCFLISMMSTMAYQSKVMMFMNMQLEASQPITNIGFYLVFFSGMFVFFFATPYICYYLHYLLGYIFILAIDAMAAMSMRSLYSQIMLTIKLRRKIRIYIQDA